MTKTKKYLCFFGCGTLLQQCFKQLSLIFNKNPDFICDNKIKNFLNIKTTNIEYLLKYKVDVTIIITIRNYSDILIQLFNLGFTDIRIVLFEKTDYVISKVLTTPLPGHSKLSNYSHLKNKWVFITGASRGLGYSIAKELAKFEVNLILHASDIKNLEKVYSDCSCYPIQIHRLGCDLSNPTSVSELINYLDRNFKFIDIFYSNAAVSPSIKSNIESTELNHIFEINVFSPIRIINYLLPKMLENNFGKIINVTSSIKNDLGAWHYASSKAAINQYIQDLSFSITNQNINLISFNPGWISTDMNNFNAPNSINDTINGALICSLINSNLNGMWIDGLDYKNMGLSNAINKFNLHYNLKNELQY
jgi:3-oxoacyl-[acyl-carrier protein] reductase